MTLYNHRIALLKEMREISFWAASLNVALINAAKEETWPLSIRG